MYKKYNDSYVFPASIEKGETNFGIHFHDLPGCVAVGDTLDEAMHLAKDGLALHLWGMEHDGEEIPTPTPLCKIPLAKNETLYLIDVDMSNVRSQMDNYAEKKPHWINSEAPPKF